MMFMLFRVKAKREDLISAGVPADESAIPTSGQACQDREVIPCALAFQHQPAIIICPLELTLLETDT